MEGEAITYSKSIWIFSVQWWKGKLSLKGEISMERETKHLVDLMPSFLERINSPRCLEFKINFSSPLFAQLLNTSCTCLDGDKIQTSLFLYFSIQRFLNLNVRFFWTEKPRCVMWNQRLQLIRLIRALKAFDFLDCLSTRNSHLVFRRACRFML